MLAMADAIERSVKSIYPPCNGFAEQTLYILNETFGREYENKITIMWSKTGKNRSKIRIPNHFAPIRQGFEVINHSAA